MANKDLFEKRKSAIKNWVYMVAAISVLFFGVYLVNRFFLKQNLTDIYSFKESQAVFSLLPIVDDYHIAETISEKYYKLNRNYQWDYTRQVKGFVTSNDTPLAPLNIKIWDPQIGRAVFLSWQEPMFDKYNSVRIYRSENTDSDKKMIAEGLPVAGIYEDKGLQDGKNYYYEVRSVKDIKGKSAESNNNVTYFIAPTDKYSPSSPQSIAVNNKTMSDNKAVLEITWQNPPEDDLAAIRIYRSTKPGVVDKKIAEIIDGSSSYLDQDIEENTIYYYTVTALDKNGNESSKQLLITNIGNPDPFITSVNTNSDNGGSNNAE